jgi:hypothetical protein
VTTHYLYLTNSRLVCFVVSGGRVDTRREFSVSDEGAADFERYLASFARVPTRLVTDVADEDFRLDTVPHLGSGDRAAIVGRKLVQIFRNTPYRHAVLQGREAEGRRDDRVVYIALTNPEVLRPWLEAIERLQVPLEGIHSSAVLSGALLEELDLAFHHTLLVTFTPGEGMRQTYFRDREVKFSRLTPIDLEEGQTLGAMVAEETTRTWQYLDSLRNFGVEELLEVCVVAHPRDRAELEVHLRDLPQIRYRILDMEQIATKLALKPPPAGSTAEEVLVRLFAMHPIENHFASVEMRRHAVRRRARGAINVASLAVIFACMAFGGYNLQRALKTSEGDQQVTRQLDALTREYDQVTKSMPTFGFAGSTMRDAVTFYNGSIRGFPAPGAFLLALSQWLQGHPSVRLQQVAWLATDDAKASPTLANVPSRNPPAVKSMGRGADAPAPAPASSAEDPNPPFAGGRYEVALVEGTVRVAQNDFRGALTEVERLAEEISRSPGTRATVQEAPLELKPSVSLQGRLVDRETPQMEPRFVLRIVRERAGGAT